MRYSYRRGEGRNYVEYYEWMYYKDMQIENIGTKQNKTTKKKKKIMDIRVEEFSSRSTILLLIFR